jgi:sugar lactone lactonase YvrE
MRKISLASLVLLFILASAASAVVPQKWVFRGYDDFLRGKFDGVSVSSDGVLTLSPREDILAGPAEDFYLSFLMTPEGVAFVGTGHEGKIYRITKEGKAELFFQASEMDVTCLAMDKKGILYAGTSPNGKIYKIASQGKGVEFFNPTEKYIWGLLFEEEGNVLAAVGESGGIYEINPQGEGRLIFKTQENHVLCVKMDKNRDIIAGSGGNGLVYRITRAAKAAVVFESPYEEVRSLALDLDGNIYAAAGGTAVKGKKEELPLPLPAKDTEVAISVSAVATAAQTVQTAPAPAKMPGIPTAPAREPGALFRIAPDGLAKRLWSSSDEMVYSLFWNESEKRIYFGTGPRGRMYALDQEEKATLVLQKNSEQIYEVLPFGVKTYLVSNNPSQLSVLFPEQRLAGEYVSPVLDARIIAGWGKINWEAGLPLGAALQFQTRSGNSYEPGPSWSDWSPPYQKSEGEQVLSPKGRYVQFKVIFKAQTGKMTPALSKVSLFYLQANVPPAITRLEILPPNEVYLRPPEQEENILGLERRSPDAAAKKEDGMKLMMAKKVERKGYQTVTWDAEDENGDTVSYTLSLRREGEKEWRTLEEQWSDNLLTFSTLNFPDGVYFIKVTASDLPSNPLDLEKRSEKISAALVIDNSAPLLKNVRVERKGAVLEVAFQAEDAFSSIKEAKYLIRPFDWRMVFPEDGICDSKNEKFAFTVQLDAKSDRMVSLLVKDASGNTATVQQMF